MKLWIICMLLAETCKSLNINDNTDEDRVLENKEAVNILSRRRRSLLFPTGTSFQLVLCLQTSALIPLGDIFLYDNTASLAWDLPTDPKFLYMFKDSEKDGQRRGDDEHHIYYTNEKGDVIAKIPYKRRKIVSPASIGKRSLDPKEKTFKEKLKIKIDRMKMHEKQSNREYLNIKHKDLDSITYHRNSRSGLLKKIEVLLTAVGHEGRQCVLYHLCVAAQRSKQGTFFQEMLRIIFTSADFLICRRLCSSGKSVSYLAGGSGCVFLCASCMCRLPKNQDFRNHHDEYDNAHTPADDGAECTVRYPGCEKLQITL